MVSTLPCGDLQCIVGKATIWLVSFLIKASAKSKNAAAGVRVMTCRWSARGCLLTGWPDRWR